MAQHWFSLTLCTADRQCRELAILPEAVAGAAPHDQVAAFYERPQAWGSRPERFEVTRSKSCVLELCAGYILCAVEGTWTMHCGWYTQAGPRQSPVCEGFTRHSL